MAKPPSLGPPVQQFFQASPSTEVAVGKHQLTNAPTRIYTLGGRKVPTLPQKRTCSKEPPVGGRLAVFEQAWRRLIDSRWLHSVISEGFRFILQKPFTI